jgi:multiple sugar transport system permease protein
LLLLLASEYGIFWSIILPLCKPGMSAIFILFSIDMWNSLIWPLIVMRAEVKFPLSVGLAGMINTCRSLFGELIAGSLLATVPMILLFLIFQRQFLTGMSVTGVIVEK